MKRFRSGGKVYSEGWQPAAAQGASAAQGGVIAFRSGFSAIETTLGEAEEDPLYVLGKRLIDVVIAMAGLVLLAPLFLLIGMLVVCDSDGPVLHRRCVLSRQSYLGGAAGTFIAFKFRTMHREADAMLQRDPELLHHYRKSFKLRNDPRVTRLGAFLRRSSLDELPQLWNVLTGEMTLVGPRIISPPELERYGDDAALLLSVRPGLSGLWQVSGRQEVPPVERVRLDLWYVRNRSLRLDLGILLRTVGCVFSGRGAC